MPALIPATNVLAAGRRLRDLVRRTRLLRSDALSRDAGGEVFLKLENEQVTGSFKVRGALHALDRLSPDVRGRGVVASSAGNHGLGVAYAARHFGIHATIFVPTTAPRVKRDGIAALGASVDDAQPHYDAAMDAAKAFAAERGSAFINPCLGDTLLAGQGTVALEILEELPDVAMVVLPVGGGGLLGGCGALLRGIAPAVRVLGAQSVRTNAMAASLAAGRVVDIGNEATLADGLAGAIDEAALAIGQAALDGMATVEEEAIARAVVWLEAEHGLRVEGSGAVGVAALRAGALPRLTTPAVVVVSGSNIDADRLAALRAAHG